MFRVLGLSSGSLGFRVLGLSQGFLGVEGFRIELGFFRVSGLPSSCYFGRQIHGNPPSREVLESSRWECQVRDQFSKKPIEI